MATARQSIRANGAVLAWARERWGMDVANAANCLAVSEAELARYEDGWNSIGPELFDRISRVYEISPAALMMPTPPDSPPMPYDFRTVEGRGPLISPEVRRAVNLSRTDQLEATELAVDMGLSLHPETSMFPEITSEDDPEDVSAEVRDILGVSYEEQVEWDSHSQAFNVWRRKVDELGVLTFLRPMPRDDCRGFAFWEDGLIPSVVISAQESPQAQSFTLFHELAHLLLRQSGICAEDEKGDRGAIESFCNKFAAGVLMPMALFHEVWQGITEQPRYNTDHSRVVRASNVLKVSRPAVAYRASSLNILGPSVAKRIANSTNSDRWRRKRGGGGRSQKAVPYARRTVNRLGTHYVRLVLQALDEDVIDRTDADLSLDLKVKHFDDLRDEIQTLPSDFGADS